MSYRRAMSPSHPPEPMDPAESFLLDYHRHHPGATAQMLAHGRAEDGRSSYALVADCAPPPEALGGAGEPGSIILDLGCGDGYLLALLARRGYPTPSLVGVDISPDELAAARRRADLADVDLRQERAQATSLPDNAAACALSHLAFMLMSDVEAVIGEIARVLAPGGVFATVLGGGPRAGDAFELFLELFNPMYDAQPNRVPQLGDRRMYKPDGLDALLCPNTGFTEVNVADHAVVLDGTADALWTLFSGIYEAHVVAPARLAALRRQFEDRASALRRPDGTLPCTMVLRLVTAVRISDI
jgi:SAM-dependent methyltransferase